MKKKIISLFLSFTIAFTIYSPIVTKGVEPSKNLNKVQTIEKLNSLSGGKLKLSEKSGQVFLAGKLSANLIPGENSALKFLDENKAIFGIDNVTKELKITDVKKDELGHTYVKIEQLINGIKVNGSAINLHFDKKGTIVSVNGKLEKNKTITTLGNKAVSESDAVEIAKKQFTFKSLRNTPKAEKLILTKDNKNFEVYKINIFYMQPTIENYDVYVEVHSGEVIKTESNIMYDGPVLGSGIDVNGNQKNLNLYQYGASYQMRDITNPATSGIVTYSLNHGTSTGNIVSNNTNSFNSEDYKASVSAHYNAGQVIDFYKNLFNRNSLDNNGMNINSFTHYDYNYNNAFWDGSEMIYGDGDGSKFTYLSGDLDIVGHEMTHGVISNTANLWYHNQSGALNESIADVFGVLIETYNKYNVANGGSWTFNPSDWVIGDEVYTPNTPGDALRSLSNPSLYNQPDNMSGYENYPDTSSYDNGGVHENSGIPNKAAYNIASLIGMEKTAKIYYRALTNYMSTYTDFEGAKDCLVQAAADLYGQNSVEVTDINTAFNNVGVTEPLGNDPYEPNNTIAAAYPINIGTTYQSYISTNTDDDYYKLHVSNSGGLNISLSDLPYDYDLELYNSGGVLIANSLNWGTLPENINFNGNAASDYFIRVYTNGDFSTAQKYSLLVSKKVTGVSLDKTLVNLKSGDTVALQATVSPSDATNKNITWSSNNTSVATVDSNGNVTAITGGTATITATTADGGFTANCIVNVDSVVVTGVSLDTTSANLKIGEALTLQAIVNPIDASNKNVTWTSSAPSIATVDNAGKVIAVGEGTATITVTTVDGGYTANCSVNVQRVAVTGVSLDTTSASLNINESMTLQATVNPTDASNKNVTWTSSDPSIATVDNTGKVTAVGEGTATITVTTVEGGYAANCSVNVQRVAVTGVILDKTAASLNINESMTLQATVNPTNASNKNVTWTSSNPSIATVDIAGKVTAVGKGSAIITVTTIEGGYTASCSVTVVKPVTGVNVDKTSANLQLGESIALAVTVSPTDASNLNVNFKSSDESILKVDSKGLVTAVGFGYAYITVTTEDGGYTATFSANVKKLEVQNKNLTVNIGAQGFITYKLYPENSNDIVLYESNNQNVVRTMEGSNYLEAVGVGTATVKAYTIDGNYYDYCQVTVVKPVDYLEIDHSFEYLKIGNTINLTVHVYPEDATIKELKWTSSDESKATVDSNGKVTAVSPGYAYIKAETLDGSRSTGCQFLITQGVTGISLNKTSVLMKPYNQETLSVNFQPSNASNKNIIWSSSNPTVASVSYGIVSAYKPGNATITATSEDGGYSASCTVYVDYGIYSVSITGVNIPEAENTQGKVKKGESILLNAIVRPNDTLFDKGVVWSSDNTEVAQVDSNGKVTGLKRGVVTIKAKSVASDMYGICKITVYEDSYITNSRLGGKDRFETSVAVSRAGWATSDNVVLANGLGFADALTGVPMAYIKDAPILLTSANVLPDATNTEIIRLNAKNIYILGGTGVVGKNIEDSLRTRGYNVIRVSGMNRFETAIAIGNEVIKSNNTDTAILTTAYDYPDALAISPYAAIKKYPVLYTEPNALTPSTKEFLIRSGIKNVIIPGGEGAVSSAVANELIRSGFSVDRISGLNRYQTALNIVNKYNDSFNYDIILATGGDFPDALAGGVLAAKKKIPILLAGTNNIDSDIANHIKGNGRITMYLLGGTGVISDNIMR